MVVSMRIRDDGSPSWGTEREMQIAEQGELFTIFSIYKLGIYRKRQYEFVVVDDDAPFAIVGFEEDLEGQQT